MKLLINANDNRQSSRAQKLTRIASGYFTNFERNRYQKIAMMLHG